MITVITVVRNQRSYLEKTIQSVLSQKYENIEYIIIDGGSTDGTKDIISKYKSRISYWISEPDKGIYDAMNKAINVLQGDGHIFLNAGDYFVGDVFSGNPAIPSFIPVVYRNFFGNIRNVKIRNYRQGIPNCHQGIIFETKGIQYDTHYKYGADYLYYLDHGYENKLIFNKCDGYVYYDNSGISKMNAKVRDKELADIIKDKFGFYPFSIFMAKSVAKTLVSNLFGNNRNK